MDDLSARMRAAAESPPPARIDLDALISGELRRRRTLRWAGGAAAVAAAATLAVAVPTVYLPATGPAPGGGGAIGAGAGAGTPPSLCAPLSPSPTGQPAPLQSHDTVRARPSEPVAQAVARLTEALRVAMASVVPDGMTVEAALPGCAVPQFQYQPSYREYALDARVKDQQGFGLFSIRVLPTGAGGEPFSCAQWGGDDCVRTQEPDGTVVVTTTFRPGEGDVGRQYDARVQRPDGVTVLVSIANIHIDRDLKQTLTRPEPPLTRAQLVQIGRTPELTLYP